MCDSQKRAHRKYNEAHKEEHAAYSKKRYEEQKASFQARARAYSRAHGHAMKLKKYGLTPEEYDVILESQEGACAICGSLPPNGMHLSVDHNHNTDVVRGLLCSKYNTMLGFANDSSEVLLRASAYLEASKQFD